MKRFVAHLKAFLWGRRSSFPKGVLSAIEDAVRQAESKHAGEIRFAIEDGLSLGEILDGKSSRDRAEEVFSLLKVWDTEKDNGVLLYVLLGDRRVEIVADRGLNSRVSSEEWGAVCRTMEQHFKESRFEEGSVRGIQGIAALLSRHFPHDGPDADELPNKPTIL
jgi:uncharacterized membrane protein